MNVLPCYRHIAGSVSHVLGSVGVHEAPVVPECNGEEEQLLHCLKMSEDDIPCHHVLVDCTSGGKMEVEVSGNETGSENNPTEQPPDNNQTYFGLIAILGIVATTLLLIVCVLLSTAIMVGLWCKRNKVVPKVSSSGQKSQQLSSDYR